MERGKVVVERVGGKSKVTRCFCKYPLKFIVPNKVGAAAAADAVWIYTITYGGGIVSVYKSLGSKSSQQTLEASVGQDALLVVIPDPVTCFSTAKYSQIQNFKLASGSSLLLVDWITSGRHESGEKWAFSHFKTTNRILLDDNEPVFLDTMLLEQESNSSIADRLQDYQAIAMIVLWGPKLKPIQNQIQEDVKKLMSRQFRMPTIGSGFADSKLPKPSFLASCTTFGPQGTGVVIRIASTTTESVYKFLQHQLASMEAFLGASPYS
ncbi:hypothetical protein MIMGU_mgv1a011970mg [Erythranthe guttata]|uniref:Urease accessory protein D n=1 Tax=Erythranthe guttata TaxID=4155 RepID=A0A022QGM6_ERYGU|nr:hypothetical protein MIMGU_mgv1a011970mg [Erythranthe guttata]